MTWRILVGDVREKLRELPDQCVQTCVTSPPYWGLRDYGTASWEGGEPDCDHRKPNSETGHIAHSTLGGGKATNAAQIVGWRDECGKCGAVRVDSQMGLEPTPEAFVDALVSVFDEVWRVLKNDGTIWVNLGDSYLAQQGAGFNGQKRLDHANRNVKVPRPAGIKPKDLAGIPWSVAFALRARGWYLRSDIIWSKLNPMPESITDRPTKSHEYLFLLSKSARYFYDADAIKEPSVNEESHEGRRPRNGDRFTASDPDGFARTRVGFAKLDGQVYPRRNARSVWTIPTQAFTDWTKTTRRVRVSWDESDGDTTRIASPDCPVHGDLAVQSARALCGERADDSLIHIGRTDDRPGLSLPDGCAPTDQRHEEDSPARSSGSPLPSCVPVATDHSNRMSRTGRAPATIPPCMPSAETSADTDGTSMARGSVDSAARTLASSTAEDSGEGVTATVGDGTPIRIGGKCSCEYYRTITEEMSHFATFPEALVEPCIKAGSRVGDLVLDPFTGSGTTGAVALRLGRSFVGCELNPKYVELAKKRIGAEAEAGYQPPLIEPVIAIPREAEQPASTLGDLFHDGECK